MWPPPSSMAAAVAAGVSPSDTISTSIGWLVDAVPAHSRVGGDGTTPLGIMAPPPPSPPPPPPP